MSWLWIAAIALAISCIVGIMWLDTQLTGLDDQGEPQEREE